MRSVGKSFLSIILCLSVILALFSFETYLLKASAVNIGIATIKIENNKIIGSIVDDRITTDPVGFRRLWGIIFYDGNNYFQFDLEVASDESFYSAFGDLELLIERHENGTSWRPLRSTYDGDLSVTVDKKTITWSADLPENPKINKDKLGITYYYVYYNGVYIHQFEGGACWGIPIESCFDDVSGKAKYTKIMSNYLNLIEDDNEKWCQSNYLLNSIFINEWGKNIDDTKKYLLRKHLEDILLDCKYRPFQFGGKEEDIKQWPYQNGTKEGTEISGVNLFSSFNCDNVKWSKKAKGCCSYARFVSQYVNGSIGSYSKNSIYKLTQPAYDARNIKNLIENYADPGEPIHYLYNKMVDGKWTESEHWVSYLGCNNEGFYFISYEGGLNKKKTRSFDTIDVEYITYEKLADTCKNKQVEVWDTNGGTYKSGGVGVNEDVYCVSIKVTVKNRLVPALKVTYSNGKVEYITNPNTKNAPDALNEFTFTLNDNEFNTVEITGDGKGYVDYLIEYEMSDGSQNTREFKNVPIDKNKTIIGRLYNCYDQGNLEIIDNLSRESVSWSCGMNETATEPELEYEYFGDGDTQELNNDMQIHIPLSTEVEYASTVTVKATATDVPKGYYVALYEGNTQLAKGDNTKVSYTFPGEYTSAKNITVKIIDDNGNVQKDSNGNELTGNVEIKAKSGFFAKLIAFFKRLFKALPSVTVEPK